MAVAAVKLGEWVAAGIIYVYMTLLNKWLASSRPPIALSLSPSFGPLRHRSCSLRAHQSHLPPNARSPRGGHDSSLSLAGRAKHLPVLHPKQARSPRQVCCRDAHTTHENRATHDLDAVFRHGPPSARPPVQRIGRVFRFKAAQVPLSHRLRFVSSMPPLTQTLRGLQAQTHRKQ